MISNSQTRFTAEGLTVQQQSLMELMRRHQFGRIENIAVRGGQPVLDPQARVVQVMHLGKQTARTSVASGEDFELKRQVRDLFAELIRLENGTVIRLEFRHGLPFLLETAATDSR